jgi:hypothetical protein
MITAIIILSILVIYFLIRSIKTDSSNHKKRNEDGSYTISVSYEYVNKVGYFGPIQCPKCGLHSDSLHWFEYRTDDASFTMLAGRQGFYAICTDCKIKIEGFPTTLS